MSQTSWHTLKCGIKLGWEEEQSNIANYILLVSDPGLADVIYRINGFKQEERNFNPYKLSVFHLWNDSCISITKRDLLQATADFIKTQDPCMMDRIVPIYDGDLGFEECRGHVSIVRLFGYKGLKRLILREIEKHQELRNLELKNITKIIGENKWNINY